MIGIVVVSHSAKLAEGVVELARNMGGEEVQIQAAGGMNLPDQPLGTDAMFILDAIQAVYSEDGVLVLMDLGSAILSAEMAIEMLPEEQQAKVVLCEAPLVEGAISAAVQARIGSPMEQVIAEARSSLSPKAEHLNAPVPGTQPVSTASLELPVEGAEEVRLLVTNRLGLHARPAARFVKTAGQFTQADIQVRDLTSGRGPASAKSINAITTLGVSQGHELLVSATGAQAKAALSALQALAEDNFGDIDEAVEAPVVQAEAVAAPAAEAQGGASFHGSAASEGIAIGPVQVFRPVLPPIPAHTITQPAEEWAALEEAIGKARTEIESDLAMMKAREAAEKSLAADQTADIFEAHLLFLGDELLLAPARSAIFDHKLNPAAAWQQAVEQVAQQYRDTEDAYLKVRAKDVEDVGRQVLVHLLKLEISMPHFEEAGILIAHDLTPAETARLEKGMVLGICTAAGGVTSHTAILARSMGIPAITGMGAGILELANGTQMVMDGGSGSVWVNPSETIVAEYTQRARAAQVRHAKALAESQTAAVTRDGHPVEIVANIGSAAEVPNAVASGAEGVGLFRTEFLFLDRQTAPTEDEQYEAYRAVTVALAGRPVIIRTLDAGGDKFLPYLNMKEEANPFLGLRAIRLCLARPDLFKTQLRAIARLAAEFPVRVMFPMVATLSEWRQARGLLQESIAELRKDGLPVPVKIETGIMVEIPAAALKADQFAREVDFFSIGTNDLTQYTMAAERGNPLIASLSDPFHPAVLELIRGVVTAAHQNGKWVGVCGEMAGDPRAVPLLVGLGVDELSMSAPAIPRAKQIVRSLEYAAVRQLAEQMPAEESPEAIREKMEAA